MHDTVEIDRPMPPDTYPPIHARQGKVSPVATGVAGLVGGALLGGGYMASRRLWSGGPEAKVGEKEAGPEEKET
jgi:hypothetical protein